MKSFRVSIVFNIFGVFLEIRKECNAYISYLKKENQLLRYNFEIFFIQFFDLFVYLMGVVKPLKILGQVGGQRTLADG